MDTSVWIAFLALAVVIMVPAFQAWIESRQTMNERSEIRRRWRRDFLHNNMRELIELRAQLQYLQDKGRGSAWQTSLGEVKILELEREREIAYGKAFGLMLTIPNAKVRGQANRVMEDVRDWTQNEKLEAINGAIVELGNLLDLAIGEDERISQLKSSEKQQSS